MNLKEFKQALPFLLKANVVPFMMGHAGTGKTESIYQFAEQHGYHLTLLNPATQDVGDLIGLPFKVEIDGELVMKFAPPTWLHNALKFAKENPDKLALVFLDEMNRARRDVQNVLLPLIGPEKRLHEHYLPENVKLITAGNPPSEEYNVADMNEGALNDRVCFLNIESSVDEWIEYAESKNYDVDILELINEERQLLRPKTLTPIHIQDYVKPSPRALSFVNNLVKTEMPESLLVECIDGLMGRDFRTQYVNKLKNAPKYIKGADILQGEPSVKKAIKDLFSAQTIRMDIVSRSLSSLLSEVNGRDLSDVEIQNLVEFLDVIPSDLRIKGLKAMIGGNDKHYDTTWKKLGKTDMGKKWLAEAKHIKADIGVEDRRNKIGDK